MFICLDMSSCTWMCRKCRDVLTQWLNIAMGLDMSKQCPDISLWCQLCCKWHQCIHHITMINMRWYITFWIMWCHWYHYCSHVMLTASSMAPFCSLGEGNWNKVWSDPIGHAMLFVPVLASHDTDGIVNGTISFVSLRWLKQDANWLFGSCDVSVGIT